MLLAGLLIGIVSCTGGNMPEEKRTQAPQTTISKKELLSLSGRTVFFGHQSVGQDIIGGIRDILKEHPDVTWQITETHDAAKITGPGFFHARIGQNATPVSKCEDFERYLNSGIAGRIDYALMKFCFIDISHTSSVAEIFQTYQSTMSRLKSQYRGTTFVHVTVPLMTQDTGTFMKVKDAVKSILGRPLSTSANIKRDEFNRMLKREYQGKEPVFDLAAAESTLPDGTRTTFDSNGMTYPLLAKQYAQDSGHLNETGRKKVAQDLLAFLAALEKAGK